VHTKLEKYYQKRTGNSMVFESSWYSAGMKQQQRC